MRHDPAKLLRGYRERGGGLSVLSNGQAVDPRLTKASKDFKTVGRALVAKVRLQGRAFDQKGGAR